VGIPVEAQFGTAHDPNVEVKPLEEALYIGGGPKADDVSQGGFGDCYFLAALLNVLNQDPERVKSCIQTEGVNVRFSFWMTPDQGTTWTRTSVTTDRTALQWIDTTDASYNSDGLIGSGVRIAPDPITSDHFAEIEEGWLSVFRADIYEMALWAPLLEKVYARIAEKFNEYAGFKSGTDANTGATGYDRIEGGWPHWVYPMFYGPDFISEKFGDMDYQAGDDAVALNQSAIENLLRTQGYRGGDGATQDTDEHVMLSVSTGGDEAVTRLVSLIDHCSGLEEIKKYRTLRKVMGQVRTLANNYQSASTGNQQKRLDRLSKGCDRQVQPGSWPLLESPNADKIWRDLHESLAIVGQLGTDSSAGTRNIYADHAYSVIGVRFVGKDGNPTALNIDNIATELPNISGTGSTVTLRNPHHTNEPNLPASMVDQDSEDGVFRMSLDAYLRAFDTEHIGRVKDT